MKSLRDRVPAQTIGVPATWENKADRKPNHPINLTLMYGRGANEAPVLILTQLYHSRSSRRLRLSSPLDYIWTINYYLNWVLIFVKFPWVVRSFLTNQLRPWALHHAITPSRRDGMITPSLRHLLELSSNAVSPNIVFVTKIYLLFISKSSQNRRSKRYF